MVGRRAENRTDLIILDARDIAAGPGYGATSMDAVALIAGVSKATVYAHFADKYQLFAAIVATEDAERSRNWNEKFEGTGDVRARLSRLGRAVLDLLLAPETIATHRMVAAEAIRFPEIGRAYYENGAARLLQRLEEIFTTAMAAGALRRTHPRRAAEQFVGLIRGDLQLRSMLGVETGVAKAVSDAVLRSGVDTFFIEHTELIKNAVVRDDEAGEELFQSSIGLPCLPQKYDANLCGISIV